MDDVDGPVPEPVDDDDEEDNFETQLLQAMQVIVKAGSILTLCTAQPRDWQHVHAFAVYQYTSSITFLWRRLCPRMSK